MRYLAELSADDLSERGVSEHVTLTVVDGVLLDHLDQGGAATTFQPLGQNPAGAPQRER